MSLQQTIYINDILHLHTVINNELWPRAPRENRKNMPRQLLQKTPASFLFCEKCLLTDIFTMLFSRALDVKQQLIIAIDLCCCSRATFHLDYITYARNMAPQFIKSVNEFGVFRNRVSCVVQNLSTICYHFKRISRVLRN